MIAYEMLRCPVCREVIAEISAPNGHLRKHCRGCGAWVVFDAKAKQWEIERPPSKPPPWWKG